MFICNGTLDRSNTVTTPLKTNLKLCQSMILPMWGVWVQGIRCRVPKRQEGVPLIIPDGGLTRALAAAWAESGSHPCIPQTYAGPGGKIPWPEKGRDLRISQIDE